MKSYRQTHSFLITLSTLAALVLACALPCAAANKPPRSTQELPWGIKRIGANLVWPSTTGRNVRVAVLDTGIETSHPDLVVAGGANCVGHLASENNQAYSDTAGHGTGIAGVIAALNNNFGVVGVGPGIELYAVRFKATDGVVLPASTANLADPSTYSFPDLYEGLKWCMTGPDGAGVDVICISSGLWTLKPTKFGLREDKPLHDPTFYQLLKQAYNAGIVIVVAAGNGSRSIQKLYDASESGSPVATDLIYDFPGSYPEVITVGATGQATNRRTGQTSDYIPDWSNFGQAIDLFAPGYSIDTTDLGGSYQTHSGTSFSSPHVAGVVAVALASHPLWNPTPDQVLALLQSSADPLPVGTLNPYGAGLVNAAGAVTAVTSP